MEKDIKTFDVNEIASWFIIRDNTEEFIKNNLDIIGKNYALVTKTYPISKDNLQILLYIAYGYYLRYTKEKLFLGGIEASSYIPTISNLESRYKTPDIKINKKMVADFIRVSSCDIANLVLERVYRTYTTLPKEDLENLICTEMSLYNIEYKFGANDINFSCVFLSDTKIKEYYTSVKLKDEKYLCEQSIPNYAKNRFILRHFCEPKTRELDLKMTEEMLKCM